MGGSIVFFGSVFLSGRDRKNGLGCNEKLAIAASSSNAIADKEVYRKFLSTKTFRRAIPLGRTTGSTGSPIGNSEANHASILIGANFFEQGMLAVNA